MKIHPSTRLGVQIEHELGHVVTANYGWPNLEVRFEDTYTLEYEKISAVQKIARAHNYSTKVGSWSNGELYILLEQRK